MQVCSHCSIQKPLKDFYFRKESNKYRYDCKECFIIAHPRRTSQQNKEHYSLNKAKILQKKKEYRNSPEFVERANKYQLERHHKRMKSDPLYVLVKRYRSRTRMMFRHKGILKKTSSMEFLGCTAEEFKSYFESLFTEGMTWGKVYSGEIHIDHKTAISTAKTEEDLVKLSHYTNLQPLWAIDNLKKGKL
jgi:hypothetical protein